MRPGTRALGAARAAIGARFRLHGRSIEGGLDCVGLVALAMRAEGLKGTVPSGYALRSGDAGAVARVLGEMGLVPAHPAFPGDLLLLRVGGGQLHLAIASEEGLIHADAMLKRVVERPSVDWPVLGRWRLPTGE